MDETSPKVQTFYEQDLLRVKSHIGKACLGLITSYWNYNKIISSRGLKWIQDTGPGGIKGLLVFVDGEIIGK